MEQISGKLLEPFFSYRESRIPFREFATAVLVPEGTEDWVELFAEFRLIKAALELPRGALVSATGHYRTRKTVRPWGAQEAVQFVIDTISQE